MAKQKTPKKNGRPEKITPEIQAAILGMLKTGCTLSVASQAMGVDRTTIFRFRKRNKGFATRANKAISEGEEGMVAKINKSDQWQASAWLLERRFGKRWGRKDKVDHTTGGKPIALLPIKLDGDKEV